MPPFAAINALGLLTLGSTSISLCNESTLDSFLNCWIDSTMAYPAGTLRGAPNANKPLCVLIGGRYFYHYSNPQ